MYSCFRKKERIAKNLLSQHIDIMNWYNLHDTALHIAAQSVFYEALEGPVDHEVEIFANNRSGQNLSDNPDFYLSQYDKCIRLLVSLEQEWSKISLDKTV